MDYYDQYEQRIPAKSIISFFKKIFLLIYTNIENLNLNTVCISWISHWIWFCKLFVVVGIMIILYPGTSKLNISELFVWKD